MLLSTLACGLDFGGSDDAESLQLEQTRVALQQTQIAIDALAQEAAAEEPVAETAEPAEPVVQPDVSYGGISFSFDNSITGAVSSETVPGQNMGEDYMPGDTFPTYTKFLIQRLRDSSPLPYTRDRRLPRSRISCNQHQRFRHNRQFAMDPGKPAFRRVAQPTALPPNLECSADVFRQCDLF